MEIIKFGDVAKEIKENTKDPLGEGIERYIGLEHIEPESLRLERYGLIAEDKPTFSKKFNNGDILFGRRRAYLKKAAVADFKGICSGDIIVIAPKGNILIHELLPFVIQSKRFFEWAVKHSAGGLSPRTKFKSLQNFEFLLPSKKKQEEILEILSTNEDAIFEINQLKKNLSIFLKLLIKNKLIKIEGEKYKISDLITRFSIKGKIKKSDFKKNGIFPIIDQSKKFIAGYCDDESYVNKIKNPIVIFGDHTRCLKYIDFDFAVGADGVKILNPIKDLNAKFFYYSLLTLELPNLGYSRHSKYLKEGSIKVPKLNYQLKLNYYFDHIQELIDSLDSKLNTHFKIRNQCISKFFNTINGEI